MIHYPGDPVSEDLERPSAVSRYAVHRALLLTRESRGRAPERQNVSNSRGYLSSGLSGRSFVTVRREGGSRCSYRSCAKYGTPDSESRRPARGKSRGRVRSRRGERPEHSKAAAPAEKADSPGRWRSSRGRVPPQDRTGWWSPSVCVPLRLTVVSSVTIESVLPAQSRVR